MYNFLYKLIEWTLGEKIVSLPELARKDQEERAIQYHKKIEIPFDYKILILADSIESATTYAHGIMLEPRHWAFVDSKQDIYNYSADKCEIHLAGNWFRSGKIQEILDWASRNNYELA